LYRKEQIMKLRLIWILSVLLLVGSYLFASSAFAAEEATAAPVAQTETGTLGKGGTLWALFMAQKRPLKEWPNYWKEASQLSGIPHTAAAWKKLPVGTVITAPRDPVAIEIDELNAQVRSNNAKLNALVTKIGVLGQRLDAIQKAEAELRAKFAKFLMGIAVLALLVVAFVGIIIFRNSQGKNIQKETIDRQKSEAAEATCTPSAEGVMSCCTPTKDSPSPVDSIDELKERIPPHWHST
jgi:hypothetical protein